MWSYDAEVSAVERRERAELHAFGDDDEAGVGAAEAEVGVGLDQLGDPPCICGCDGLDLEFAVGDGAEELGFRGRAELSADQVGGFGDHERGGYERARVLIASAQAW